MDRDAAGARQALKDIERVRERSLALGNYAAAGPALTVWGFVWLLANIISWAAPDYAGPAWGLGVVIGVAASVAAGLRKHSESVGKPRKRLIARSLASSVIVAALVTFVATASGPQDQRTITVVLSLLVAGAYGLAGVWAGARFLWLGGGLAVAITIGWMFLGGWLELWLGFVCGALLILTGLWLRRA